MLPTVVEAEAAVVSEAVVAVVLVVAEVAVEFAAAAVAVAAVADGIVPAWAVAGVTESAGEAEPLPYRQPELAWRS